MKTPILIATAALIMSIAMFQATKKPYIEAKHASTVASFGKWMRYHNKTYSPSEYLYRMSIFEKKLEIIQEHNNDPNAAHEAGLTKFSDLTRYEFVTKYSGGLLATAQPKNFVTLPVSQDPEDEQFDWRDHDHVTPVADQQRNKCLSCWAFSAIAAIESAYKTKTGKLEKLSEQQIVDCAKGYGSKGCHLGWMGHAFDYLTTSKFVKDSAYPYIAEDGECKQEIVDKNGLDSVTGYISVLPNSPQQLKAAVKNGVVSVAVNTITWDFFKGGILKESYCSYTVDHAVAVVGYGMAQDGMKYWLIKNSYGRDWGDNGYIKLERKDENGPGTCGIQKMPLYPLV